jgi:hypothetical protein
MGRKNPQQSESWPEQSGKRKKGKAPKSEQKKLVSLFTSDVVLHTGNHKDPTKKLQN